MKAAFSTAWKASKQPRKQRKYVYNAPLHIRRHFVSANLSKDLRKEYGTRNIPLAVGDTVKVMRGNFGGEKGLVDKVDLQKLKVSVKDVKRKNAKGTDVPVLVAPSNLQIVELNLKDKKRAERLKGEKKAASVPAKTAAKEEKK